MVGDAAEHVAQVCLGIEFVESGGLDEGVDGGGAMAAGVGTGEQPVLAVQGELSISSLPSSR
jgi:hypothetical protein